MTVFERIIARYKNEQPAVYAIYQSMAARGALGALEFPDIFSYTGPAASGGTIATPTIGTQIGGGDWAGALGTLIDAVPLYFITKEQQKAEQDKAKLIALQELQRAQLQITANAQSAQSQYQLAQAAAQAQQITYASNGINSIGKPTDWIPWVIIGGGALALVALKKR